MSILHGRVKRPYGAWVRSGDVKIGLTSEGVIFYWLFSWRLFEMGMVGRCSQRACRRKRVSWCVAKAQLFITGTFLEKEVCYVEKCINSHFGRVRVGL